MADFRYCVGTFVRPIVDGIHTVSTVADAQGAFTPKAIVFFSGGQSGTGFTANGVWMMGFTDGVSMAVTNTYKANNGLPFRPTRSFMSSLWCLAFSTALATTVTDFAHLPAYPPFALGSFDLEWLNTSGVACDITFLALGGDDMTCVVGATATPTVTGHQAVSVPGAGPISGVLLMNVITLYDASVGVAGPWSDNVPLIGWADAAAHQAASGTHVYGFPITYSLSYRTQVTDGIIHNFGYGVTGASNTITTEASLVSLGTDTFTLNWDAVDAPGFYGNPGSYYLTISGPQVLASHDVARLTPGRQSLITPFSPGLAMMASVASPPTAAIISALRWSFGASDGVTQVNNWVGDEPQADPSTDPSVASRSQRVDCILQASTPNLNPASCTTQAVASCSFEAVAVTLDWTAVTGTGDQFVYFVLEGATPPSPPSPATPSIAIRRLRRSPHVSNEGERIFHKRLLLDMQGGLGNDDAPDPDVMLSWSNNGGATWGNQITAKAGRVGQYKKRVFFNRLGQARDRVYEVVVSDPAVGWVLADAFLETEDSRG